MNHEHTSVGVKPDNKGITPSPPTRVLFSLPLAFWAACDHKGPSRSRALHLLRLGSCTPAVGRISSGFAYLYVALYVTEEDKKEESFTRVQTTNFRQLRRWWLQTQPPRRSGSKGIW